MLCDNELSVPVPTTFLKLSTIALFFPPKIKLTRVASLVSLGRATTQNGKKEMKNKKIWSHPRKGNRVWKQFIGAAFKLCDTHAHVDCIRSLLCAWYIKLSMEVAIIK